MIPAFLLVHTASVKPLTGTGAYGDVYGEPFELSCYCEQTRTLVRNPEGDEVTASATVYADLAVDGTEIPDGSLVTVAGFTSTVVTVAVLDDGGLTGLAHRAISLA